MCSQYWLRLPACKLSVPNAPSKPPEYPCVSWKSDINNQNEIFNSIPTYIILEFVGILTLLKEEWFWLSDIGNFCPSCTVVYFSTCPIMLLCCFSWGRRWRGDNYNYHSSWVYPTREQFSLQVHIPWYTSTTEHNLPPQYTRRNKPRIMCLYLCKDWWCMYWIHDWRRMVLCHCPATNTSCTSIDDHFTCNRTAHVTDSSLWLQWYDQPVHIRTDVLCENLQWWWMWRKWKWWGGCRDVNLRLFYRR